MSGTPRSNRVAGGERGMGIHTHTHTHTHTNTHTHTQTHTHTHTHTYSHTHTHTHTHTLHGQARAVLGEGGDLERGRGVRLFS